MGNMDIEKKICGSVQNVITISKLGLVKVKIAFALHHLLILFL